MSHPYHKIHTLFNRDPETNFKKLLVGQWSRPEFEYLAMNTWKATEKVDGTNIRVIWDGYQFLYKGRTDSADIPTFLREKLADLFGRNEELITRLTEMFPAESLYGKSVTFYGEGYGAKIQKGGGNYIPDGVDFVLFDILYVDHWMRQTDVRSVAGELGIRMVPIVDSRNLWELYEMIVDAPLMSQWGDFEAEGIVMRPQQELLDRNGNRIIAKLKNKDVLRWSDGQ